MALGSTKYYISTSVQQNLQNMEFSLSLQALSHNYIWSGLRSQLD